MKTALPKAEQKPGSGAARITRVGVGHLASSGERLIAEETPVALVHNGGTTAVMMATPADIQDFALGFALSEGIIQSSGDVRSLDVIAHPDGIEARMWIDDTHAERLASRRRRIAGPTGCGLCGIDSLGEARRAPQRVAAAARFSAANVHAAVSGLTEGQLLGRDTRAVHGAALWMPGAGIVQLREDVGRHNALDKLIGAAAGVDASAGILALTSRLSVEMIQKAAVLGAGVVAAISAPTLLAIRMAEEAGLTLIGIARADAFEIFTHPERLILPEHADAA